MGNKSGKAASYRIKFTHIDTFKFHGEYEINLVKENKTKKEKVKIVCLTGMVSCIAFSYSFL